MRTKQNPYIILTINQLRKTSKYCDIYGNRISIFKRASFERHFVNIITKVHKSFLHPATFVFYQTIIQHKFIQEAYTLC